MAANKAKSSTVVRFIFILSAFATIILATRKFIPNSGNKIQVFLLCNQDGSPRTDVYVEGEFGTKHPDIKGRIEIDSRYTESYMSVYDASTHTLLVQQKLARTGDGQPIPIIVPRKALQSQ